MLVAALFWMRTKPVSFHSARKTSLRALMSRQQPFPHGALSCLAPPWRDFLLGTWGRRGHNRRSPALNLPCGEEPGLADTTEPVLQDYAG